MISKKELEKLREAKVKNTKHTVLCPVCNSVILKSTDRYLQCTICDFKIHNFNKDFDGLGIA